MLVYGASHITCMIMYIAYNTQYMNSLNHPDMILDKRVIPAKIHPPPRSPKEIWTPKITHASSIEKSLGKLYEAYLHVVYWS